MTKNYALSKFYAFQYAWPDVFADLYDANENRYKPENICGKLHKFSSKAARAAWVVAGDQRVTLTAPQARQLQLGEAIYLDR